MKKPSHNDFSSHLQRIKVAKEAASMVEQMNLAEKSMGILWEQLFDQLCMTSDGTDIATIKDLANVIHKLLQNYRHLSALQQKMQNRSQDEQSWALSETALQEIEDQLQLL